MGLILRHAGSATAIWKAFAEAARTPQSHLWFTHRIHRDLLLDHAARSGAPGWLNPPFAFFSELPARFGIKGRPISLLDRRNLVNRLAVEYAKTNGIQLPAAGANITRSSMLDSFFSEILPEGISQISLIERLDFADSDEFGSRRNAWIAGVYKAYLGELAGRVQYDPRSIHALLADRIENGELGRAINGAKALHIYGLYSTRTRRRLLQALATQSDVDVVVYTTTAAIDDFKTITTNIEALDGDASPLVIQPAPDAWREAEWVAAEVKKLIVNEGVEPHDIAVVARTGLEDTRRTLQVLRGAGIPCTARVRSALTEIGAVKALMVLFRAAAEDWTYPNLRHVLTNPYFKTGVDVRTIDRIAREARPNSLAAWMEALRNLIKREEAEAASQTDAERKAAQEKRIQRYRDAVAPLEAATAVLARLVEARVLPDWIELTRELLLDGWFDFRKRVCRPPLERNDVVRFDQRAVRQLENVLRQWGSVAEAGEEMPPADWYALLRALLAGQELVLTTPGQKGVQILEAHDAALIPFRATFVLHTNDGVFPKLPGAGGLFAEEEKADLRAAGLPIETYDSALQRETALWQAVTSGERVTITYRTTDPKGTPLLPSLLVPEHDADNELPRSADLASEPLNAMQESYQAACTLAEGVREGNAPARIATSNTDDMRHLILQAYAEQQRRVPDEQIAIAAASPWNGVMRDPVLLEYFAARYDANYLWSASQLEKYGKNPFFYLIERVLNIEEVEEADEETNALTAGSVMHDILERFYTDVKDRLPVDPETATSIFSTAARAAFDEREESGEWLGLGAFWHQRKYWICETLSSFITWDVDKFKAGEKPVHLEYDIGGDTGFALTRNGSQMLVRGRIDRVDLARGGSYRVIDYKTNTTPSGGSGYRDGAVLQAALYMEALRQAGINAELSLYRSLQQKKDGAILKRTDDAHELALDAVFAIPGRVRAGRFEAVLAGSSNWAPWDFDSSIMRTGAQLAKGASRFR